MGEYYTKWLEGEMSRVKEMERQMKKEAVKYFVLLPIGGAAILGIIAVLAGGAEDMFQAVLRNALIGLIFGIVCIPFCYLMMLPSFPVKKYIKDIKGEIEDVLQATEKETFARQMLGFEGEVKYISWIDEEKRENKVQVSKDYALKSSRRGITLVQLSRVQSIIKDVREYSVTTRGGGFKIENHVTVFPMYFYYQKPNEGEKRNGDKEFTFPSREVREEVSRCLKEVTQGIV